MQFRVTPRVHSPLLSDIFAGVFGKKRRREQHQGKKKPGTSEKKKARHLAFPTVGVDRA